MEISRPRRWVPPNSLWEITARTIHGRFLLRPSPHVNALILGVIGRALSLFAGVTIHDFIWLSNHWHVLATFLDGPQMRAFMNHVQSNVARELGAEDVHDWSEKFWGRRYRAIPVLDEAAQASRLHYLLENGVKEFLVPRAELWPGASSLPAHLEGATLEGTWVDRTGLFNARRRKDGKKVHESQFAQPYKVPVAPLPFLAGRSPAEIRDHYAKLCRSIAAEGAARAKSEKRSFLGVERILAQDPHDKPDHVSRGPAPLCHAKTPAIRAAYHNRFRAFVGVFLAVSKRYRSGELTALSSFPAWCFPPPLTFRNIGDCLEVDNLPEPTAAPPPA